MLDTSMDAGRTLVFLSYASANADVAGLVCQHLEAHGVRCWMAPRDVVPGSVYADAIVRAINEASALVLILSASAIASAHVGREVERAASKRKLLLGFRIDAAALNPALEYFLSDSQWLDVPTLGMPAALAKLASAVRLEPAAPHAISQASAGTGTGTRGPVTPPTPDPSRVGKRRPLLLATMAVVGLSLIGVLTFRLWRSTHSEAHVPVAVAVPEKSIAVLPFVDMSEKKDQEYFADGMAEEIIDLLTKVPDLRVPARTSSFYFKGKDKKASDIAHELGVAHVLEGSIRRSGNQIRVTAQLVQADSGYHIWSETYDRELTDIFKVQDDIANSVAQALQIGLMGGTLRRAAGGTQNLEAYQLYLQATDAQLQNTPESLKASDGFLRQAIQLDPKFGLAWSALGFNTILQTDDGLLPTQGYEQARQLAQSALQLSPDLAEAHTINQYVNLIFDYDWSASEAEGRKALTLEPTNLLATMFAGMLSATLGRWNDAVRQVRLVIARDPLNTYAYANLGDALYRSGRFAEAEAAYRKVLQLAPNFTSGGLSLGKILLAEGRPDAALEALGQVSDDDDRLALLPVILHALGRQTEADAALKSLVTRHAARNAYWIASIYAYEGDHDRAMEWLDRAYRDREGNLVYLLGEHLFEKLASDARFKAFLKKMHLPDR